MALTRRRATLYVCNEIHTKPIALSTVASILAGAAMATGCEAQKCSMGKALLSNVICFAHCGIFEPTPFSTVISLFVSVPWLRKREKRYNNL